MVETVNIIIINNLGADFVHLMALILNELVMSKLDKLKTP